MSLGEGRKNRGNDMATVERAVANLKKQRANLVLAWDNNRAYASRERDKAFKREYLALAKECEGKIQVIDYVLNILESEEEAVCPG